MANLAQGMAFFEMASAEGWATKDVIDVPDVHVLTFKVSFLD